MPALVDEVEVELAGCVRVIGACHEGPSAGLLERDGDPAGPVAGFVDGLVDGLVGDVGGEQRVRVGVGAGAALVGVRRQEGGAVARRPLGGAVGALLGLGRRMSDVGAGHARPTRGA